MVVILFVPLKGHLFSANNRSDSVDFGNRSIFTAFAVKNSFDCMRVSRARSRNTLQSLCLAQFSMHSGGVRFDLAVVESITVESRLGS